MKRISFAALCNLFMLCFSVSCGLNHHNISIHISESEHYFKMYAHYNPNQAGAVDEYMNKHLGRHNNMSFSNSQIDADLTLDDGTKLYMKKHPGNLEIKFNKDENSLASYKEIKDLSEGLKIAMR
jgi:hypothetical protein